MQHAYPELMAASPPPSQWRSRFPSNWTAREWNIAWREAKAEAKHDRYLNRRVHDLVHILRGDEGTGQYWADGILPAKHPVPPNHDFEMLACEGQPDLRTTKKQTQPACDAWWPKSERGCVVYVIGVGDEWSFPRRAKANNCSVYAFDPTTDLRRRQEEAARRQGFKYYFLGLSGDAKRSSSANSYGAVEGGGALATLDELARSVVGRPPSILSIDCEGCEWAALNEMASNPRAIEVLRGVRVLYLDMHFHLRSPPNVPQFVRALDFLFERMKFKLRWLRNGDGYPGDQKIVDFLGVAGLQAGFCCYEAALVREESNHAGAHYQYYVR